MKIFSINIYLMLLLVVVIFSVQCNAQISGPTNVFLNQTYLYTYDIGENYNYTWTATNGSVTSTSIVGTQYRVNVKWTSIGSGQLKILEDGMIESGLNVTITSPLPVAPVALSATNITQNSFTANWNSATNATGYLMDVATNTSFSDVYIVAGYKNLVVSGLSKVIAGLSPGVNYYFRVRSNNTYGTSTNSNTVFTLTLPQSPSSLISELVTANSFTVTWGSVASAVSYSVDVSTNNSFSSYTGAYNNYPVSSNTLTILGLQPSVQYYCRVRAKNASGSSINSEVIGVLTFPIAPVAYTATNVTNNSFTASWTTVDGSIEYYIDVSYSSSFDSFVQGYNNLLVNGTISNITGLMTNVPYYYRVRAKNSTGMSVNSNVITVVKLDTWLLSPNGGEIYLNGNLLSINVNTNLFNPETIGYELYKNGVKIYYNTSISKPISLLLSNISPGNDYKIRVFNVSNPAMEDWSDNFFQIGNKKNFVKTNVITVKGITDVSAITSLPVESKTSSTSFFDGLGRLSQNVIQQGSPSKRDVIQPIVYDKFGRQSQAYLPYISSSNNGWFNESSVGQENYIGSPHNLFYTCIDDKIVNDNKPFSNVFFDSSPLNRIIANYGPGEGWSVSASNKYIEHQYLVNSHGINGTSQEKIIAWTINSSQLPVRMTSMQNSIEKGGYYSSGQVFIKCTIDENKNAVREYTDKNGKVLLKKTQAALNEWAYTYYIYDSKGNLRYVFPPELSKLLHTNADTYVVTATDLTNWAFQYKYDKRKRMTEKKVPGADWVYMVYDERDRLVLTQDGNQRAGATNAIKYWTFTKYDELNRPIVTGIKDTTTTIQLTQADMQNVVDTYYSLVTTTKPWRKYSEKYIGAAARNVHGYSNYSYPVVTTAAVVDSFRYLTITYYDNYTFKSLWQDAYRYITDELTETVNGVTYNQPSSENLKIIGQVTGMKVKVLDGGVAGGYTWLKSVNYYDDKYRVIQNVSDNYKGGTDRVSNLYDFVGKVLKAKALHTESDVQWTDLTLATVIGNYLKRTDPSSAWTAGAASVQSLPAGQDGWVEFVASEENTARMVGLSSQNNGAHYNSIGYAIHTSATKTVGIYENGTLKKQVGSYAIGDVFRIERVGTTVKYYQNGEEIYPAGASVAQTASTTPLTVDVSLYTAASTAVGVKSSFSTSSYTILRRYVYDHAGRLKQAFHTLDNGPEVLLASNEYNELGQLIDKGLHSVNGSIPMQSIDYRYNIRGWLTSMNNSQLSSDGKTNDDTGDFFGMNLAYNEELGTGNTQTTFTNAGLVSSYTFNGNASDAVIGGLNGTVYGAQFTNDSQGNSNSACTFTANDYIDIPNSKDRHSFIQNTGIFTISAFVKIDDLNARNVIVSSTATSTMKGFCFMYETYGGGYGDHQLRFMTTIGTSGTSFNALGGVGTINDNNWHHVAVVGDGEYVRFYVDGTLDGAPARITTFSTSSATSTTLIGKTRSSTTTLILGMIGTIDELNIFNKPLSKSDIAALVKRTPFNTTLDYAQYNGNISAMRWSVGQGLGATKEMAYNFKYDPLNRLVSADNLQFSSLGLWGNGKYYEGDLTYDLNGNIKSLTRSSELGMIDNLVYDYGSGSTQSNKLLSVADRTTDAIIKSKGFIDSNSTGNDYAYDVNGNMTVDLNKGLSTPITYNYLNLPEVVTRTGNTIRYIYDATGRKLSQVVRAGFGIKQTDYAGEFVYEDDMLRFINHEEGRIVMSSEKLLYKHDGETLEGMTALNSTLSVITVNGEKYVNATSGGTGSGILPIGNAINVVPGEKYLIRIKGYRSSYNAGIMIRRNNTTISYGSYLPALVSNEAWMEQIYVVPPNTSVLEIGVGWPVPTGTAGLNVNAFELIKLESAAPEYQYNLKDHLGNVRLTFTTKQNIESNTATLEDENAEEEEGKFLRYENARRVNHYLFDKTNGSKPSTVSGGAQRLSGQANEVYGVARSISVMPGDVINMEVYAKYIDPNSSNWSAALNTLITQIASGTTSTGTVIDGGSYASSTTAFPFPVDAAQNTSGSNEAGPKAFLSWLVYDRNYNLIPSKSGFRQMSSVAKENGSDVAHELLSGSLTITEPGYVYVFLSNEQGTNPYEVYFDDFMVEQIKSPVIQAEDYYPFGLTYNNYQRENSVANNYLLQDKEWQDDLGLNVYDFEWRQYDPTIGRTTTPDPHSYNYWELSPYSFLANNPISTLDPTGMDTVRIDNTVIPDATLLPEVEVTSNDSNQEDADNNQDDNENNAEATASVGVLILPMESVGTGVVVTVSAPVMLLTAIFTLIPNTTGDGEMEALEKMRLNARKPVNALPDKGGPPNGKLERRNPQTGEMLQEKWYDDNGNVYKEKNYGHDHGVGDPHMHDWDYPSPLAPNPVRGPGRPLQPGE